MTHLAKALSQPCLIERVDGLVIIEPLAFISTYKVYAKGRKYGASAKLNFVRPCNHSQGIAS